ncbi:MAG: Fe-S cluster assembly protein SufD [Candidatus Omnitrophica bacterium]|nr:Fe-S cluster assembly protein SufD [Candidatus Omnitrophota bacterium]
MSSIISITQDQLAALSQRRHEPEWLRSLRLSHWQRFEQLPEPSTHDEEWRRNDLSQFDLASLTLATPEAMAVQRALPPEAQAAGVRFADLAEMVRTAPEALRPWLMSDGLKTTDRKWVALHSALWTHGTFLYVPPHVTVAVPLRMTCHLTQGGVAVFPHTCIVADRGSQVMLFETTTAATDRRSVVNTATELFIQEEAQVAYVNLQAWDGQVVSLTTQRAHIARGGQCTTLSVYLGGQTTKAYVETLLTGEGAVANLLGLHMGEGHQQVDLHTLQDHHAPRTTSDQVYKAVLGGSARSLYTGLIHIRKPAQKSNAYQLNKNLLLTNTAKADSIPKLEIEADDVRCTHGAAVGHIDAETEFYLMSRGLSRQEAGRLIIHGFFEQVLGRLQQPPPQGAADPPRNMAGTVQEEILEAIDRKIAAAL